MSNWGTWKMKDKVPKEEARKLHEAKVAAYTSLDKVKELNKEELPTRYKVKMDTAVKHLEDAIVEVELTIDGVVKKEELVEIVVEELEGKKEERCVWSKERGVYTSSCECKIVAREYYKDSTAYCPNCGKRVHRCVQNRPFIL